ncbi:ABC transporter permease [Saccharomonospora xinjiangensis]|uniref:ABC-2 family transporter protein n=1 Tax=Saccharomonospora xinjiangensis XJ-54 TaxID=882086 RepID=I0V4E2_9PSEU|nr:ABC transporter permease [Saccharomonospora xinjiangensis]EID54995.1 hypothetical protein SacxiDRAFT_2776 [Saccharomonospora xinjiangensis XJ-54]
MNDVIASEWLKVRSVRSTYWLLAAVAGALVLGTVVSVLMVADWDASAAAERERFASADMAVLVLPFLQFCVAVFGGLTVTSEYTTGSILSTLAAVPRRGRVLLGKVVVVGTATMLLALATTFLMLAVVSVVVGDRPSPIAPWESMSEGVGSALAAVAVLVVTAHVALCLGVAIRASAGTLVTMTVLLFVLPVAFTFLPEPWNLRLVSGTLPALPSQLAGSPGAVFSPGVAAVVLAAYVVLSSGIAYWVLTRRDA